jgi:exonuclease SbcC
MLEKNILENDEHKKLYTNITDLSKKLVTTHTYNINLDYSKQLLDYLNEYKTINDKLLDINNKIANLKLVNHPNLEKEYNDFIKYKRGKQDSIMIEINKLLSDQNNNLLYIDKDIKLEVLLSDQHEMLILLNETHEQLYQLYENNKNLFIMDNNDTIMFNNSYNLDEYKNLFNKILDKLYREKQNNTFYVSSSINDLLESKYKYENIFKKTKLNINFNFNFNDIINSNRLSIEDSLDKIVHNESNISDIVSNIRNSLNTIVDYTMDRLHYDKDIQIYENILKDIETFYKTEKINNKIVKIKEQIEDLNNSNNIIQKIKSLLQFYLKKENDIVNTLDDIQNKIFIINSNKEKQEKIDNNNKLIDSLRYQYNNINVISTYNNEFIEVIYNRYLDEQKQYIELNNEHNIYNTKLSHINDLINETKEKIDGIEQNNKIYDQINELILKSNYRILNNDYKKVLDTINNDIIKNQNTINDINDSLKYIEINNKMSREIDIIDKKINSNKIELNNINDCKSDIVIKFRELQDNLLLNSKYNTLINKSKSEINDLEIQIKKNDNELLLISNLINEYNDSKIHIEHNNNLNQHILSCKKDVEIINNENNTLLDDITIMTSKRDNLNKLINNIEKTNNELDNIRNEMNIYEMLVKMTSRDGIQLFLLSESLQLITNKVNSILEPFINKTIKMVLNHDNIELSILSKNDSIIHTISGMESFMLDLVFKIIIGQISVIPKANIIFMDESISVLDADRMSSIDDLFTFLKLFYNTVFLITHMKQVNNHINYSINIVKHQNNSLINNN